MAGRERLLDPTGDSERAADTTLAPRLSSLRGLTAGLLDNAKPNAATLLAGVAAELKRAHGLRASVLYTKSYFGTPAEESLIQRILHNCGGGNMSEQAQVEEALRGLRDMLATDGYELRWSLSSPGTVLVQVVAAEGACADCLVPRPLMEGILSDALGPTPYALDRVVLPADG